MGSRLRDDTKGKNRRTSKCEALRYKGNSRSLTAIPQQQRAGFGMTSRTVASD